MKKIRILLICLVLVMSIVSIGYATDEYGEFPSQEVIKGKVLKIISEERREIEGYTEGQGMTFQTVRVLIKNGAHKGEEVIVENVLDDRFAYNINIEEGIDVLLALDEDENGLIDMAYITDIARDKYLYWVIGLFIVLLVLIGGFKGLKSVITLSITVLAIFKLFLPLILKGYNPVTLSVAICIGVIAITLVIISGINVKSISAIIGTSLGVLVAGILTLIISHYAHLTGLGSEEAQMLTMIPQGIEFNFRGILFSAIILGALGAVMDVSMSIASSMHEIRDKKPDITIKELFKSGMNVGRDIMGTMSNTLILAYTGGSIHLMLLFKAYNFPILEIINRDIIASEIVRALAGSIGLIFTIPITALVFTLLVNKKKTRQVVK
ncbi:YibE/F family protein [Abyssisolibacter fermentans]|uniref:YibE/F family protein n=1 Tax=Abyssisolibacter fermentans TaxID=1766203 RepID=UPI0008325AFD|nr:YibE/F family protein [Abyssisolibacter fermentans]